MSEENGKTGVLVERKLAEHLKWGSIIAALALQAGLVLARVESLASSVSEVKVLAREARDEQLRSAPRHGEIERRLERIERLADRAWVGRGR